MHFTDFSLLFFSFLTINLLLSSSAQPLPFFSNSSSPWLPSQNRSLLSPQSAFAAGFRTSPTSPNLFIFSVWYFNISNDNIVWSANWDSPVNRSASLIISSNGELQLINGSSGSNLWPDPPPRSSNSNTRLVLRDDGNLVFGSWESFDHPTDTFLPNQTFQNSTILRSRNRKFSFIGSNSLVFNRSDSYWSTGTFVSLDSNGQVQQSSGGPIYSSDFGQNRTRRLSLGDDGNLRIMSYDPDNMIWYPVWEAVLEICGIHGLCGPGYICYSNGSTLSGYECVCPPGFRRSLGSDSCERKTPIVDMGKSKFLQLDYVNFSGESNRTYLQIFEFVECESQCKAEQRCVGFGFKFDGSGYCVLQLNRLLDGYWSPATDMVFYLRVDNSERDQSNFTGMSEVMDTMCPIQVSLSNPPNESDGTTRNLIIIIVLFVVEIAGGVFLFWSFLKRYVKYRDMAQTLGLGLLPTAGPRRFSYAEMKSTTNNFSEENVIGKGGFSDVYEGKLQDGRPVAVKCLKNITGGDAEFWAEVTIIARMHHLNLVRLWGFCNEKGRRILVYERVPNGSLDNYLFRKSPSRSNDKDKDEMEPLTDPKQKPILDWNIRYRIALGVARAIAYLHEECLEWVLHCDIKPENILLGDDFCPKVADFGLSKLRKKEQLVTMSRIRGTRGYLAPEWVKNDSITSKVDVYSFGMVLLEIVTGVRNLVQGPSEIASEEWYLPQWAFEMAIEEKRLDQILDHHIKDTYDDNAHFKLINRMVKTAMWCVQERPEMRPSMGKVAKMLEGTVEIIEPPKPTIFFIGGGNES